jgi:hypothetical protein
MVLAPLLAPVPSFHYWSKKMADRYQYQSGPRRGRQDWRDDDDSRRGQFRSRDDEGERGEGADYENPVRGGSYDQNREQFGRFRDTNEQSGSTGRYAGYGYERGSSGTSRYGRSEYGDHGYGASGGWSEPYGEGQQYTSRGEYAGSSEYGFGSRGMGQHRGKGPKGFQRSDERIKELICERLSEDPDIDPSDVTVSVMSGKITLDGTVDSRRTKNAIEDVAEQFGIQEVQNNLRVQRQGQTEASGRPGTSASGVGKGTSNEEGGTRQKHN